VFRDWLIKKGLSSSSVKRVFSTIRAITNLAIAEYGLDMRSPFANVYFPELDDIKERLPVSPNDIKLIQRHCRETNAHFGVIRPPFSVWSGHPFQYHPATRFGIIRPPMTV
jgi:hypothetical protein